jgi:hypothetical protein
VSPSTDRAEQVVEPIVVDHAQRAQLRTDGYASIPGFLPLDTLASLRVAADRAGQRWSEKVGDAALRSQGSMVGVPRLRDPLFGRLIADPRVLAVLDGLGLGDATFTDGYVISKPGRSPRLFWHFDWYGWDDESSYGVDPVQVFVMYYLTDTTAENGCLRVVPGSHLTRHPLHDVITDGHVELSAATDLDRPEFADWPGERDVPVRAGDLVIGDARLLHAAHANRTDERRSLITLWYQPHFDQLSPAVQATLAAKAQALPEQWPDDVRAGVAALLPPVEVLERAEPLGRSITGPRP